MSLTGERDGALVVAHVSMCAACEQGSAGGWVRRGSKGPAWLGLYQSYIRGGVHGLVPESILTSFVSAVCSADEPFVCQFVRLHRCLGTFCLYPHHGHPTLKKHP